MGETKVIANYLPQYHEIPENNKWWGKGYTDWVAVKKAKPMFDGHVQPRVPLNGYYDLTNKDVIRKQAEQARSAGIYGFGIYHYWFSSDVQLLQRPAEIIRDNADIDISYMFIWDNYSWKRTWSNVKEGNDWAPSFDSEKKEDAVENSSGILAELVYGTEEDWEKHFQYLVPFFKDSRYIKKDGRPVFVFFVPTNNFETVKEICAYWNRRAIACGFPGIFFISKSNYGGCDLDYSFRYQPFSVDTFVSLWSARFYNVINRYFKVYTRYSQYDYEWKRIIDYARKSGRKKVFNGAFVGFDDTPRRGKKARLILGQTPAKFEKYMRELLRISSKQGKEFVFLTAWNEWGEGAYLEPDTRDGYAYLEALKRAIDSVDSENV